MHKEYTIHTWVHGPGMLDFTLICKRRCLSQLCPPCCIHKDGQAIDYVWSIPARLKLALHGFLISVRLVMLEQTLVGSNFCWTDCHPDPLIFAGLWPVCQTMCKATGTIHRQNTMNLTRETTRVGSLLMLKYARAKVFKDCRWYGRIENRTKKYVSKSERIKHIFQLLVFTICCSWMFKDNLLSSGRKVQMKISSIGFPNETMSDLKNIRCTDARQT